MHIDFFTRINNIIVIPIDYKFITFTSVQFKPIRRQILNHEWMLFLIKFLNNNKLITPTLNMHYCIRCLVLINVL